MSVRKQKFGDNLKISINKESPSDKVEIAASMDVKHNMEVLSTSNPSSLTSPSALKVAGGIQVQRDVRANAIYSRKIDSDDVIAKKITTNKLKIGSTDKDISSISIKDLSCDDLNVSRITSGTINCYDNSCFKSSNYIEREKFFSSSNFLPSKDIFLKNSIAPSNEILLGSQDHNYIGSENAIDLFEFNTHGLYSSGRENGYFIKNDLSTYAKLSLSYDISNFAYISPESLIFSSISIPFAYYSNTNTDHKSKVLIEYSGYRIHDNKNYGTYLYRKCFDIDFDINSSSIFYDTKSMLFGDDYINLARTDLSSPLSSNISHNIRIKVYLVPESEVYIRGLLLKYKTKNIQDKS